MVHVGGINPYTLKARIGLKGLAHYKIICSLIDLLRVPCKEGTRGDQTKSLSVRIGIDIQLSMAIVTN